MDDVISCHSKDPFILFGDIEDLFIIEGSNLFFYNEKVYDNYLEMDHGYSQGIYIQEKEEGLLIEWYSRRDYEQRENDQKKSEGKYFHGKQEGFWTYWHSNGQKKSEGKYSRGKLNGFWTSWYSNGQKRNEGNYSRGKLEGLWTLWGENGKKSIFPFNGIDSLSARFQYGPIIYDPDF